MGFVGRKPTNAPLTSDDIPNGIIGAADLASGISGLITWQSVQTTGFTAVAGRGYPCNTTSAAFTVTLPASPSVGDTIILLDYAGTFATNNITLGANSNKINGVVANKTLTTAREAVTLVYTDATQGWVASSGTNFGSQSLDPVPYSVDFLVVAGGGGGGSQRGGGGGAGGYRNSYSTETSGGGGSSETSLTFIGGTVYTITVGAGGTGADYVLSAGTASTNGVNSSISGSGITTITSTGGGFGAYYANNNPASSNSGGSGGGGLGFTLTTGSSGTANQGYAGGNGSGAGGNQGGGGGGGASAVGANGVSNTGGNGGNGLASSITGSSVTRAGGGGAGTRPTGATAGTGGTGGGGNGASTDVASGSAATANTGGGGGGGADDGDGGNGGSGVVILRMPTSNYSGTTTGSPTVTTDGSDTVIVFNSSGSITG